MDYQNKTLLITGAYRGIGKSIAEYFAKMGVNVILTYHNNMDKTLDLAKKIKKEYHVKVECLYLNLCQEESIIDVYNYVKEKYKKIDYLINNAALSIDCYVTYKIKVEFMKVLETNVVGTFLMMKYFDNIIDGFIFNISSTDGIDTGSIYSIDYNVSKAAIINLTTTFSLYSKNKIICICPNWVDTDSTNEMDKSYLSSELKRIKQEKLINVDTIPKVIDNLIKKNTKTGSVFRIEGDNDVRRIN